MTHSFPNTHNARNCHHIALLSSGWKTHSPSSSVWAHPPGCHSPVARLKHSVATAAQPHAWPEPPLAGEENSTNRRTHDVVTPPMDLWSDDEDGKPCYIQDRINFTARAYQWDPILAQAVCNCYALVCGAHHTFTSHILPHLPSNCMPPRRLAKPHTLLPDCMQPRHCAKPKHLQIKYFPETQLCTTTVMDLTINVI